MLKSHGLHLNGSVKVCHSTCNFLGSPIIKMRDLSERVYRNQSTRQDTREVFELICVLPHVTVLRVSNAKYLNIYLHESWPWPPRETIHPTLCPYIIKCMERIKHLNAHLDSCVFSQPSYSAYSLYMSNTSLYPKLYSRT